LAHQTTGRRLLELTNPIHAAAVSLPHVVYPQALDTRVLLVGYSSPQAMAAGVAQTIGVEYSTASRAATALCKANLESPPLLDETEVYDAVSIEIDESGDVSFLGNDSRRERAERDIASAAEEEPLLDSLRLDVRHREGFAVTLFLEVLPDLADQTEKLLNTLPISFNVRLWRGGQGGAVLLDVTLRSVGKADVEGSLRRVVQLVGSESSSERGLRSVPRVWPVYATWPTSMPFEEFEILSEKQSAQAWLSEDA
ncbi:MAG: hypothetical protein KDA37_18265, partial [Planctomycetales bacterium]|nr:hypothetical protein [Planctomycetales bacterium]